MKIAACQMVSGPDVAANLTEAARLIAEAASGGARLVALPEYFCLMGQRDSDKLAIAEPPGQGPIQAMLRDAARDLGLWVVGGTLPMATPDPLHVANTTLVFSPEGAQVASVARRWSMASSGMVSMWSRRTASACIGSGPWRPAMNRARGS